MSIEKAIKDHAIKIGMDMCGIAPVSRFEGAPKGTNPTDFLPGCKSVISVGVRLVDGAIQNIMRNFEDGNRTAQGIYGTYGYTMAPNFHLLYAVYDIAQFIERKTGSAAAPTPVGPLMTGFSISQRHAAVAAGRPLDQGRITWKVEGTSLEGTLLLPSLPAASASPAFKIQFAAPPAAATSKRQLDVEMISEGKSLAGIP